MQGAVPVGVCEKQLKAQLRI